VRGDPGLCEGKGTSWAVEDSSLEGGRGRACAWFSGAGRLTHAFHCCLDHYRRHVPLSMILSWLLLLATVDMCPG
jgi:hypothetical protein